MSQVTCHVSPVRWQVAGGRWQVADVPCQVSCVIFYYFFKSELVVELVGGGSVINGTTQYSLCDRPNILQHNFFLNYLV